MDQRTVAGRPFDGIGISVFVLFVFVLAFSCISRPWAKERWSGGHLMAFVFVFVFVFVFEFVFVYLDHGPKSGGHLMALASPSCW